MFYNNFVDKLSLSVGSALAVVAHPDDETIWMGGTILANPQVKWTVFSLCRADDRDRAPKFRRVCKFLRARAIISDLDDEEVLSLRESLPEIRRRLRNFLFTSRNRGSIRSSGGLPAASRSGDSHRSGRPSSPLLRELPRGKQEIFSSFVKFDFVFTHGYNGEYGHPRHRGVSRVVNEMVRSGEIKTNALYNFSYEFDEKKNICRPKEADVFLKLSPAAFKDKRKIINELYGFKKSSFEYRTLSQIENFKLIS